MCGGRAPRGARPLTAAATLAPRPVTLAQVAYLTAAQAWLLDQATKALAVDRLASRAIELPGPFHLQLTYNDGGAFGLDAPWWFFLVVTVIVLVVVGRALRRAATAPQALAYGLLIAGALGNATDRLLRAPGFPRGRVVDFIASTFWPTFNLADIAISTGFVLLLIASFRRDDPPQ